MSSILCQELPTRVVDLVLGLGIDRAAFPRPSGEPDHAQQRQVVRAGSRQADFLRLDQSLALAAETMIETSEFQTAWVTGTPG